MLEIYKGIKIEEDVIIVERQNEEHQGYLVCKNNKNQLESALVWAKCSVHVLDKDGNHVKEQVDGYTRYKFQELEGIVHEYRNGQFTFSLSESASGSSQGGKLSFWNCTIAAPDGKEFLIGINSECLIQLLKHNTFINGVCQNKVWLGRIKNNVGAFTENMEEFEQGKKDKAIREAKKTSKYDIGAILIPSNKVYCGKFFKTFDVWTIDSFKWRYSCDYSRIRYKQIVNIHSKPVAQYLYKDYNWLNHSIYWYNFINSKTAGVLSGEIAKVNLPEMWEATKEFLSKKSHGLFYQDFLAECQKKTYSSTVDLPDAYELMRLQYISEKYLNQNCIKRLKEYFDKYKIPYVIDADEEELKNQGYIK